MLRRQFLGTAAAAVASGRNFFDERPKRVGLIGTGWYGKVDLLRLIQISPVEVVSLCDVDRTMVDKAADIVASRQRSKKRPRTYHDYREMLKERDLDLVLIATPDHWHALPMIAAVQSGADVYCQKPISVDVMEAQAMLAAARKYGRVVQIGTQRRSTPHLVEARDQFVRSGKIGKVGVVEVYCYYPMRARENPPDIPPPAGLDWDFWTGPAPLRGYNKLVHPRGWRGFMEYSNGIIGDMCVHMFDMARWMLELGWPKRISSSGGILIQKGARTTIPDTQTATFDYGDLEIIWNHRTYGAPADEKYPWGATFYGDKGTLKAGVYGYDYIPLDKSTPVHKDVTYEYEKYPEDRTEPDLERHVAPAVRYHMLDLLACIGTRGRPVADIEQGYISTASCILANMAMQLGRTLAWDEKAQRVASDDEANVLLRRPYRAPWVHPEPERV